MSALKIKVLFVSVFDGGNEITTSASLNLKTGELSDFEKYFSLDTTQMCDRKYIILNDEKVDVVSDEDNGCWVMFFNGHPCLCTENYQAHLDAVSALSITQIIKIVDYVAALSQYVNDDIEILEDMDAVTEPFYTVIGELRTDETCGLRQLFV